MQLQMTAPLDIGLEQSDAALNLGQDDIFDLEHTERSMKHKNRIDFMTDNDGDVLIEDEDGEGTTARYGGEDGDDSILDEEEERERKVAELEAEMDGLYDSYRERLQERDAKFKVKEQRKRRAEKEEWHGVEKEKEDGSDSEESEGGWDLVQNRKLEVGSDSDDSESESEEVMLKPNKKRNAYAEEGRTSKRRKLVPDLAPKPMGKTSSVWFQQDVFAGVGDLDVGEDEDDEMDALSEHEDSGMEVDGGDDEEEENSDDYEDEDEDFEVVPQDQSEDETMWDIDGENEDTIKQEKIKSTIFSEHDFPALLTHEPSQITVFSLLKLSPSHKLS
jgi:AdoMet-dependent rRNA methyltransferase SPB1